MISNRMWEFWADAPNEQSQVILDQGMSRRAAWDLLGALQDFDRLVEYCPDYAEGYNQRAFVNYLRQDYTSALRDLDRTLQLSPAPCGGDERAGLIFDGVEQDRRGAAGPVRSAGAEPLAARARAGRAWRAAGAAGAGYLIALWQVG